MNLLWKSSWLVSFACAGLFAGKPAPTGTVWHSMPVGSLWERVPPQRGQPL
ncbi:hypothetical protein RK21_03114 [Pseudomonas plecoglossicida]|nr:hypothetical protein RK21_03114 [Pseudomonas plecoglossicida]